MTRFVENLLRLERGDLGLGLALFFYLFFVLASFIAAKAARDALFLDRFSAVDLPYVDIALAVLVGFVVAGYIRLSRRLNLRDLLVGSLLFFATNCLVFWWLDRSFDLPWLPPVIYVWTGLFGVLGTSQVWTLANYVLTIREAKRVFGLVGSGAILGGIVGGLAASVLAPRFGTGSLFLAITLALVICSGLVFVIWRQKEAGETAGQEKRLGRTPHGLLQSLRLVGQSSYLRSIAGLILIGSLVTSVADWQFKAIASQHLLDRDSLTAFFGAFMFWAGIVGLLLQLFLASRFLRKFGLGPALFVMPSAILLGSLGVLVAGGLWAAVGLRGSINVFRYSIDRSSLELLYLPIPGQIKVPVKSFIDTVVQRLGDGLSGGLVLLFAAYLSFSPARMSGVALVLIVGWFAAALIARGQYVATLRELIREHRLDSKRTSAPVLDRSTADIFAQKLTAADPKEILYALGLFDVSTNLSAHPAMRSLLTHPSAEIRRKAVSIFSAAGDKSVRTEVEPLLRDPDIGVRTEAMLYQAYHAHVDPLTRVEQLDDLPEFSLRAGIVAFLARPGELEDLEAARVMFGTMIDDKDVRPRQEAARLLSVLPEAFDGEAGRLLSDPEAEVVREAVRGVGKQRKRRFVPKLFELLSDPEVAPAASEALVEFGDGVVGTMRDNLVDTMLPVESRRKIAEILAAVATPSAARALGEAVMESDTRLRFQIIASLNKLHKQNPGLEIDRQLIETLLGAEILGHYRSYQILGTMGGDLNSDDPMTRALRKSMKDEIERIFRLLSLLFPTYDLHSAYFGLQSKDAVVRDNALEFLDNRLKPEIRSVLVPVLDGTVSVAERVRLANQMVGAEVESREEAVVTLIHSNDPWLMSCGAYAIGAQGLKALEKELEPCLAHPDPLLRETARRAQRLLNE